jgi:acetyl-CoA synthetase
MNSSIADAGTSAVEGKTGTQSLERAVALLRAIASHGNLGARLADLVMDSGFNKATVRRLLAAMIRESLLEQDEKTRRYYLGVDTFVLGTIASARFGVRNVSGKALSRLSALSHAKYVGDAIPLASLLCDRHCHPDQPIALLHESAAGHTSRLTYAELAHHSKLFAGVLRKLGVTKGDRVATLLPKGPEFLIAMIAIWRLGAVNVPLFIAFGHQAISYRLNHSGTKVVITNGVFRRNLNDEIGTKLKIVTVEADGTAPTHPSDVPFWSNLYKATLFDHATRLGEDDPFVLLYTSGRPGAPKGILVPVKALASIEAHMRLGLDLRDDDVYWNLGDPGWAGALYYGVIGPLLLGQSTLLCDGPFDVGQIYRVLLKHKVTNLYATPIWYRAMRSSEKVYPVPAGLRLRVISSIGELLADDLIQWVVERLHVQIHDHYGQSETGAFVSKHLALTLQPAGPRGSIGQALPGFCVVILDERGRECGTGETGEIAIDTANSPLYWFGSYYGDSEGANERFRFGRRHYLTGDLGRMDADKNIYFLGTKDDLINSNGNAIVPSEVEAALSSHPAVAEAAAVGKSDRLRGEIVRSLVILNEGFVPSPELAEEIAHRARAQLPAHALQPEIEFVARLPRTLKGKLNRRVLRNGAKTDHSDRSD